jgi:hypothetical protein
MVQAAAGSRIDVIPSVRRLADLSVTVSTELKPGAVEAVAFLVATDRPSRPGWEWIGPGSARPVRRQGRPVTRPAGQRPDGPGRRRGRRGGSGVRQ